MLSRLTPRGETVEEIVQTMALNRLSLLYAEGRVVDLDVMQGGATLESKGGTRKQLPLKIEATHHPRVTGHSHAPLGDVSVRPPC